MGSVLRVVSAVIMVYGAAGFVLVLYYAGRELFTFGPDLRGSYYFGIVAVSLLAMHTIGVGGVIWVVQRLAYPPKPRA